MCLNEFTAFEVKIEDELLHDTSAVIAIEGDLDLQVCSSTYEGVSDTCHVCDCEQTGGPVTCEFIELKSCDCHVFIV